MRRSVFALLPVVLLCVACSSGEDGEASAEHPAVAPAAEPAARPVEHFEFDSYRDVEELFERLGYTPARWQAGIREVPRLYFTRVPSRWKDVASHDISVLTKKRLFFRGLAPLALHANELILEDRSRLEELAPVVRAGERLSPGDRDWLNTLARRYRVLDSEEEPVDSAAVAELLVRVDAVPISLVLAQSAEESGWGTSRFAERGNALFGQWTFGGKGIKPQNQRTELGDHRIAAFEQPLDSVMSYMLNLNRHPAYRDLRTKRAELRAAGEKVSGRVLAETLTRYSERGEEYVKSLHAIMRVNQLDAADDAFLDDGPTIYITASYDAESGDE